MSQGSVAMSALSFALQPRSQAAVSAAAGLDPGHGPGADDDGDPIIGGDSGEPGERRGRRLRLSRLRIGWHTVSRLAVAQLGPPAAEPGLILGLDEGGRPVVVPFFGPEPVRAVLVGDVWCARVLLLRALGLGAAAVVVTSEPAAWRDFGRVVTGEPDRVLVLPEGRTVTAYGSAGRPALLLQDLGGSGPVSLQPQPQPQPLGPWQTRLTVLGRSAGDEDCDLLLVQHDDALVVVRDGARRKALITPTSVELQLFGPPRRF